MDRDLSRLRELVEVVLPAVLEDYFSLEFWENKEQDCNTIYCACGWAAVYKPFTKAGLSLIDGDLYYTDQHNCVWEGYLAASKFFNITENDASYLFYPDDYPKGVYTAKQEVIDRITDYIKENQNG